MTLRYSTTRAIGTAIALTLVGAAAASAQDPSRSRIPVRKEGTPSTTSGMPVSKEPAPAPAPAPAPEPAPAPAPMPAPAPADTMATTTTTTTTTSVSTGEVPMQPSMKQFGNGFYVGIAGGASFPQNELNRVYKTGFNVEVPIGWDPANSPLGLRLNLGYNRLRADDRFDFSQTNNGAGTLKDPQVFQAVMDAKLRIPFGHLLGATSGLYAVGGGGAYYFRNYTNTVGLTVTGNGGTTGNTGGSVTNTFNTEDRTRFGANVGGGVSWGLGRTSLYVESRYVRVFTPNRDSDYVPVMLGLTFH
jgi:hypothetical protein